MTELIPRRTAALLTTIVAALIASLLVPLAAHAATPQTRQSLYPSVTKVAPLAAGVGDRLVITGKSFRKGKLKNTVVFKRDGKKAVFVRATGTSTKRISVKIPTKMLTHLGRKNGKPVMTRFRVRVLANRFGTRYTAVTKSPRIGPPAAVAKPAASDCDGDGIPDAQDPDDDNDLLPDALEKTLGTDLCKADTDGDGILDSFEYHSALDLNSAALPYPGKRPYPNALDKEDADIDHDGDGLTMREEQRAWLYTGGWQPRLPLTYSDGQQWTGGKIPASSYPLGADIDRNGTISDDEKDVDGDGLTNWSEVSGPLSGPDWWDRYVADKRNRTPGCDSERYVETPYPAPAYKGLDFTDPDSDGDGIPDGADDIDRDGFTNLQEQFRSEAPGAHWCDTYVSLGGAIAGLGHNWDGLAMVAEFGSAPDPHARVQPFNPCKPIYSDACHLRVPLGYYKELAPTDSDPGWIEDWASPIRP